MQQTSEQTKKEASSHIYGEETHGYLQGEGSGRGSIWGGRAKGVTM